MRGEWGGVVLCGGQSRRMGRPKAWLPFGGEPLLVRVVKVVQAVAGPVVVAAGPGQEVPPLPAGVAVVRDPQPGLGPLWGLLSGWRSLPQTTQAAWVVAVDLPLLQPAFLERLGEVLQADPAAEAVVPEWGGQLQPLAAVYRRTVLPQLERMVAAGQRRMLELCAAIRCRRLPPEAWGDVDPDGRSLYNVNTPDEYAAALRLAGLPSPAESAVLSEEV